MKTILASAALAAALLTATARADDAEFESGGRVGQFRGYELINLQLSARLLDPTILQNRYFEFSRFFAESYPLPGGLASLLGGYSGSGTTDDFRNGTPNGVNMLLWHLGFFSLAQDLGQVCTSGSPEITTHVPGGINYQLDAPVFSALHAICDAGHDQTAQVAALQAVWMAVHSYDLPEEEMQAFSAFFSGDADYLAAAPAAQIGMAVNGVFLNPLFLLGR